MADSLKRFYAYYKSKAGDQRVALMARNRNEAEVLANSYQLTRASRYSITMQNLEAGAGHFGDMAPAQRKAELERRKRDFSRYDIVSGDEVGAADAPLKLDRIEEAKQ